MRSSNFIMALLRIFFAEISLADLVPDPNPDSNQEPCPNIDQNITDPEPDPNIDPDP
jgi:hypothetical protein